MMRDERSKRGRPDRGRFRCALGFAVFASGCATGVDVTDDELAEICSSPNTFCSTAGSTGGGVGGSTGGISSRGGSSGAGTFGFGGNPSTANGGTFSGNGGTGATGVTGSGGTGTLQPLAEGDCLDTNDLVITYRNRAANESTNEPSLVMGVQNSAGATFDLSTLTIRYWFTADGTSNFIPTVDYATLNGQGNISGSISVTFAEEFGSNYAQMSFAPGAGTVDAQGVRELQLRFHADPYQAMNQANDFSFLASATALTPNPNITPYLNGEQVGGCVPAL